MSAKNIEDQDFEDQSSDVADSSYDEPYEDDTTYSDDDSGDWAEDGDMSDELEDDNESSAPVKKKSSTMTVVIVAVVAVVAVLGFMVMSGSNESAAPEQDVNKHVAIDADPDMGGEADTTINNIAQLKAVEDQVPSADEAVPAPVQVAPSPVQPSQGLMDNPDVLNQPSAEEQMGEQAPQPTLTAPDMTQMEPPVDMAAQPDVKSGTEIVDVISPNVKAVSDFPTVDSIKKPVVETDLAQPAPVTPVDTAAIAPAPVMMDVGQDKNVKQVQGQLDAAQEKIKNLEKLLAEKDVELSEAISKATQMTSSDSEIDSLKSKISELEDRLAEREDDVKTVVPERMSMSEDNVKVETSKPTTVKNDAVTSAKVLKPAKQLWSLKSASSSKAILFDKATGDLKTISVGDTVPALGRIVSITNGNSIWVVKGTTGSVSE